MKLSKQILVAAMAISLSGTAGAAVKLPSILCDGMVVQRGEPVRLWGTADPGESVTAKADIKKGKAVTVAADENGNWLVELPALKAGGPYKITVNDIAIGNVLCGDVFLCSGQSNMELPVSRVTDMFADEVASYSNENIRHYAVPQTTSFHGPLSDTRESGWRPCTQKNAMSYSALAYFFAKRLYEETGVPVGIINSSWGGTPVESWIPEESVAKWPADLAKKRIYEDDDYRARIKKVEGENYHRWNVTLYATDPGLQADVKWHDPALDDSDWNEVDLLNTKWGRNSETRQNITGSHWLRKHINLTAGQAAGDATLRLGCFEGADSAFVNGVFVGTVGYQYPPRIYKVPEGILHAGENVITVRGISGGGEPRFVQEKPYKLIFANGSETSLEGIWKHHVGSRMPTGPGMVFYHYTPVVLHDAMISPLYNMPVAGAVWYQGESNVSNRFEYAEKLTTMISDWRKGFDCPQLPFYIVELADFLHPSDTGGRNAWAEMRGQQASVADADPNAYLIKNSDLGEWNDIHPLDKKTLGNRVAEAVIANLPSK